VTRMAGPDRGEFPFSRPLAVSEIPEEGLNTTIRADETERAALAAANGLVALTRLEADFRVERGAAGALDVTGTLTADVRQSCVVTLEYFDASIVEPIHLRFVAPVETEAAPRHGKSAGRALRAEAAAHASGAGRSHHAADMDDDPPDPLIGGEIDLGAVAAEFLTLGLDPYPKKPGAHFQEPATSESAAVSSPFAKLRSALKSGHNSDES
jgi:hypothetical protein